MDIRPYIQYFKLEQIDKDTALSLLKSDDRLTSEEKNLIYAYCYPRQLGDYELPSRVKNYRQTHGIDALGLEVPHMGETTLILEAGQTEQYGRFIKHLMHSFCNPEFVYPINGTEVFDCCICGKDIFGSEDNTHPDTKKQHQAYGSINSDVTLCINCLIQLVNAHNLVEQFDPGFMDWTKKMRSEIPLSWNDIKLKQ